jgi:hypothetical protein
MGAIAADRIGRFAERTCAQNEAATMDELLQRVSEEETLAQVCAAWDIPHGRVRAWLSSNPDREAAYEAALRIKADGFVAETIRIADDGALDASDKKVRIDTRFRAASVYDRARFGDGVSGAAIREIKIVIETTNGRAEPTVIPGEVIHGGEHTSIESV